MLAGAVSMGAGAAQKVLGYAFGGVKGVGSSVLAYYLNPVNILIQLVSWGLSAQESKRLMEIVSEPKYDDAGDLILVPGTFPFPVGLYEAVLRPDKLKTKKVQIFYKSMRPQDVRLFEITFVPIKYATINRQDRASIHSIMKRMKIARYDKSILERRLSMSDLHDPYMVYVALHMNGSQNSPRTREWVQFYKISKGLACVDAIENATQHRACLLKLQTNKNKALRSLRKSARSVKSARSMKK